MKCLLFSVVVSLLALFVSSGSAATLKWSGARNPAKVSAEDGVTKLSTKIGRFVTLSNNAEWAQVIFNVNNRFPGSTPWVTLAVGDVPDAPARPAEAHEEFLSSMDSLGADVFLEIFPRKTNDVLAATDAWLGKLKHHSSVKGFGVDLEYYQRVDDATAKSWDEKIKSHNPRYRMFLKHWEIGFMPPSYRSDIIFIDTSSEASVEELNTGFVKWAAHFAPSACAFQFGYPADEDGMDGKNTTGWWKLNDPIKDWGNSLLAQIKSPEQEIGFLWVCVKSGKTYNAKWDLTKGATVPTRKAAAQQAAGAASFPLAETTGAQHRVSNAAEVTRASSEAKPGDVLVMSDGEWRDQAIVFSAKGTAEKPIILRAQTPGKVVLTDKSSVTIEGEHLVASGLFLQNGTATGDGVKLAGRNNRLTESAVVGGSYKFFVHLFGTSNRFDHCYLAEKTNDDPTLQIEVQGKHNYHVLDHNHFGHRPPLNRNGGETIRVGYSHQSMTNSGTLVENNLFERCDGELEIISSKSCENIYRANTFLDCAGMLTLRHGNRCTVEGNFFIAHHTKGSGGIRVIGEDHVIINNYIDGVEKGGFWITSGISNSELKGYFQARNCVIAFNTFVDSRGPAIELDAGFGSSGRTLRPENITIANNVFSVSEGALLKGKEGGSGYKWMGNIASAQSATEHTGLRIADPKLARGKDGLWRPVPDSPVRGIAEGNFPAAKTDIDGQGRKGRLDAGCDQISDAPITRRPLTATDVGPAWNLTERTKR